MNNPFPYSDDNKRYLTMNYYMRHTFGHKVAKVPLNAGFTCPNRDGAKGIGGCAFCSAKGSGDSILLPHEDLMTQYQAGLARMQKKWPDCLGFAYFQSFTNTYADLERLQQLYTPFIENDAVIGISIATRPDCLDEAKIAFFQDCAEKKETWIELGLQSIHERTMARCNRQHTTDDVRQALERLKPTRIKTCVHIINGLPGESKEDMLATARWVASLHPDAIKIHMLHIIKDTEMARWYASDPFPVLSLAEYVDITVRQLEVLPPDMVIERLTGDGMAKDLIAPLWTIKKTIVTNEIDKQMVRLNTWQGKYY